MAEEPPSPEQPAGKRIDKRPVLTLKGEAFGPELRSLLNMAAKRTGETQNALAARLLRDGAQRILKGEPAAGGDAGATVPATVTVQELDARDARLMAIMREMLAEHDARRAVEPGRFAAWLARLLGRGQGQ